MGLIIDFVEAVSSLMERLADVIASFFDALWERVYPSEMMEKRRVESYRRKRITILRGSGGTLYDKELIKDVADYALQEARIRGYEYDTLVLTRQQYKALADIPSGVTIAEAQGAGSDWAKAPGSRLDSHKWEQNVYVTHSDAVDGMVLLDSTEM